MTQSEIHEKIDQNNHMIEDLFKATMTTFILNHGVADLIKENEELQKQCQHEYDDNGVCIYCYSKKEE